MSSNKSMDQLYAGVAFASKGFSGVDPDRTHLSQGGYHVPRNLCSGGDYSVGGWGTNTSPRDRGGDGNISCAIDIRFSTNDMIVVTKRLIAAAGSSALRGVREFNGTIDGRNTLNRDAVLGWRQNYTPDDTHLWHVHIGFFRDTANDWRVISDVMNVINGVTGSGTSDETIIVKPPVVRKKKIMYFASVKGWVFVSDGIHCEHVTDPNELNNRFYRLNRSKFIDPETGVESGYSLKSIVADPADLGYLGVFTGTLPAGAPVKVRGDGKLARA